MRRVLVLLLCVAPAVRAAPDALDVVVRRTKAATVFIKVDSVEGEVTGTGFLYRRRGNIGHFVTNAHVVDVGELGGLGIRLVLNSGMEEERVLPATILSLDREADLAVLEVSDDALPEPVDATREPRLVETTSVHMFGFPFGEALALREGNPAISVADGSISSLRRDRYGRLVRVQIDGDLNPGNSGGPIVDDHGALVGVSVSTVLGTDISFAVPRASLEDAYAGKTGPATLEVIACENREATVIVRVPVIDPERRLRRIRLGYVPTFIHGLALEPSRDGRWGAMSDEMERVDLAVEGHEAVAQIKLTSLGDHRVGYYLQVSYGRGASTVHAEPSTAQIDFSRRVSPRAVPGVESPDAGPGWLGGEASEVSRGPGLGKVEQVDVRLPRPVFTVGDARVTALDLFSGRILPCLQWDADGSHVYALESEGILRKVSVPQFSEVLRLALGFDVSDMARSSAGLAIVSRELQELLVIDEATFEVKKRLAIPHLKEVASSPASSIAIVSVFVGDDCADDGAGNGLQVVDLRRGVVVREVGPADLLHRPGMTHADRERVPWITRFQDPTVTPDGRYLLFLDGESLRRVLIDGDRLEYQERGPRITQFMDGRIVVSPDSRYVMVPCESGNAEVRGYPIPSGGATYAFRVEDLAIPVITMETPHPMGSAGLDPSQQRLYAQTGSRFVGVFTPDGKRQQSYDLEGHCTGSTQLLVHPAGGRFLLLAEPRPLWIEPGVEGGVPQNE